MRELEQVTGLRHLLVSYHLAQLRNADLVTATAHGRTKRYALSHPDLDKLAVLLGRLENARPASTLWTSPRLSDGPRTVHPPFVDASMHAGATMRAWHPHALT